MLEQFLLIILLNNEFTTERILILFYIFEFNYQNINLTKFHFILNKFIE